MPDITLFEKYAPYLIPFLGAMFLIVFTKQYLFKDLIPTDQLKFQIDREKELIACFTTTNTQLLEIAHQLETMSKRSSEQIKEMHDRSESIEQAIAKYVNALHQLNATLSARPCLNSKSA